MTPIPFPRCRNFHQHATTPSIHSHLLTVRLLEARAGTLTTELLGLTSSVVGDEEGSVELDEGLLEEVLGVLVDELLVVGDQGLGDGLSDGVDLRGVTTAGDADADVDVGELVEANNQEGLVDLWVKISACCSISKSSILRQVSIPLVQTPWSEILLGRKRGSNRTLNRRISG